MNEINPPVTHCTETSPTCKEDVLPGKEKERAGTSLTGDPGEGQGKEGSLLHGPVSLRGRQKSYYLQNNVFVQLCSIEMFLLGFAPEGN